MKIYCIKEELEKAVSYSERITGKNLSLPVLNLLILEAKNKELIIKATNLELGIEVRVPAKIDKEGLVAIPASILKSFLSNTKEDKITIELKENNLVIETKSNSTLIKSHPCEDFPTIPRIAKEHTYTISSKDLVSGLRAVWYSAAISSMKPELSSVYIYESSGELVFVATDGFRLAEKKIRVKNTEGFGSVLIPSKNLPEIIKILEGISKPITLSVEKNQISIESDGLYLMSRVVDGSFPDYKQIIPKNFTTEAYILKQDFIDMLKISNIFADSFNQLSFSIQPNKKEIVCTSTNNNVGQTVEHLHGKINGEPLDIKFNFKYIADSLSSIDTDSLLIKFAGLGKPATIQSATDNSFLYLVMPMNR